MDCQKYFTKLQIIKMHIYCKKCKKYTSNTFPKKIVFCLTERSFIDEIQYDLESALEIYLQFFTD